ncbi:hypothetical protein TNCV_1416821 [Trichonephila clavipes]|nr:hypothetical protein TNCV_1416821 [Trichonephila clavipes]
MNQDSPERDIFRQVFVWKENGARFHLPHVTEKDRFGGKGILVWGSVTLGSRPPLHVFDTGIVNAQLCLDEVLEAYKIFVEWINPQGLCISVLLNMFGMIKEKPFLSGALIPGLTRNASERMGFVATIIYWHPH